MTGLLLIAHAPLASALAAVARHTFPDCAAQLMTLDVAPQMDVDDVEALARGLLRQSAQAEVLVLTDVFGATPCNAAQRLLDSDGHVRVVSGVNVPMLWRTLCYAAEPLAQLAARALEGGSRGILQPEPLASACACTNSSSTPST